MEDYDPDYEFDSPDRYGRGHVSDDDSDYFQDGLIEYYQYRPDTPDFNRMPLITFAAWYVKRADTNKSAEDNGASALSGKIQLQKDKGIMFRKQKKNVIRLPKFTLSEDENLITFITSDSGPLNDFEMIFTGRIFLIFSAEIYIL